MDYAKCDAMDVTEYILWYCENELNKPINNLRLQKTLYYIQGEYLRRYNKPLFDNDMEAWTYGVVVPYVYYSYSNFICDDITGVTRLHKDCLDDKDLEVIHYILDKTLDVNIWEIVEKIQQEDPWKYNYVKGYKNIVSISDMKEWFCKEK